MVPLMQKSAPDGLVYKTTLQTESSAEAGPEWDVWCKRHVERGLERLARELHEAIGEVLGEERHRHRRECEEKLAPLRQEVAELRGKLDVLVGLFGGKADVVSLSARKLK